MQAVILCLTLSIAGWIVDICFGQYRVICLSIWLTWAALMLATASSVSVTKTVDSYNSSVHRWSVMN